MQCGIAPVFWSYAPFIGDYRSRDVNSKFEIVQNPMFWALASFKRCELV